jgi:TonB family protein
VKTPLAFLAATVLIAALLPARATAAPGDVPAKVVFKVAPDYPAREFTNGIRTGDVRMLLRIDPVGRLDDALVTAYSLPGFADEAQLAVKKWKFQPSRVDGDPAYATLEVQFQFNVNERLATAHIGPQEEAYFEAGKDQFQYEAVPLSELDHVPSPAHRVAPTYPQDWAARGLTGSVLVEFYIDETGRVRMPTVVSADHPELGWIALPAIGKWRFDPPTRKGKPVLVKAQQDFQF